MNTPSGNNRKRIYRVFVIICVVFSLLILRLGWIQIVDVQEYREKAINQQTRDIPMPAKRGVVFDRKGRILAESASTYTVWANLSDIVDEEDLINRSNSLAEILGETPEAIKSILSTEDAKLVKIAKWINKNQSDAIKSLGLEGIWITDDNKRYYPFGSFLSRVLGHTTNDNKGLVGIELAYEKYLSGLPGRWIKSTDAIGRQLSYGTDRFHEAEDGLDVVLTIDEVIQHFVEKAIKETYENTNAKRVMAIMMDPETGDILAMATYPNYNPNLARAPMVGDQADYDLLTDKEKQTYWNKMWRNPIISDTYEPGSTFKLITSAVGLEENVVTPKTKFNCTGYYRVANVSLRCWSYRNPHGEETLTEAVQNSCNPVFMEIGQNIGIDKFYQYIESFGFAQKTDIDLPGEVNSIMIDQSRVGPVELATISYGQGISVTPLQLITAISALGNDGFLMKPRVVKELVDHNGQVVQRFDPEIVREVVSKKTAEEIRTIMESVVTEGSGKHAYIPGYRIGGKTGTADKVIDGRYADGKVYASFVGMAPIDDPKVAVLVIVDEPEGVHFGSLTAAPAIKEIMGSTLKYLDIEPQYTLEESEIMKKDYVIVPDVTNLSFEEAKKSLKQNMLAYELIPYIAGEYDLTITDQYPKPGEGVKSQTTVILYHD